jgi:hypothetical protein
MRTDNLFARALFDEGGRKLACRLRPVPPSFSALSLPRGRRGVFPGRQRRRWQPRRQAAAVPEAASDGLTTETQASKPPPLLDCRLAVSSARPTLCLGHSQPLLGLDEEEKEEDTACTDIVGGNALRMKDRGRGVFQKKIDLSRRLHVRGDGENGGEKKTRANPPLSSLAPRRLIRMHCAALQSFVHEGGTGGAVGCLANAFARVVFRGSQKGGERRRDIAPTGDP